MATLQEALLDAVLRKDYSGGTLVQISVYEERLLFWNEGHLPESWMMEQLQRKHPFMPSL